MIPARNQSLYSIAWVIAGFFLFSFSDTFVKLLSNGYHISQVIFLTGFLTTIIAGGHGLYKKGWKAFKTNYWFLHLLRALLLVVLNFFNVFALARISLTDFYVCVFTAPFWIVLFSYIFLKERINRHQVAAISFGFLTIMFMMRPSGDLFSLGAIAVLAGSACFAVSMIILKKMGPNETRYLLIMSASVLQVLVSLPFLAENFIMPDITGAVMFSVLALCNVFGGLFVILGFQSSPDTVTVAPYHYTQMIWGVIIGYFVFDDLPTDIVVMGSTVLACLGIYLIRVEYKMIKMSLPH